MLSRIAAGVAAAVLFVSPIAYSRSYQPKLPRTFTVSDLLHLESIGRAQTSPDDTLIVWEQALPYDHKPDYSVPTLGGWDGGYQLMAVDLSLSTTARAKPLFRPNPDGLYWLNSISPGSRFISYLVARHGIVRLGTFDRLTGKTRDVGPAPYRIASDTGSAWIDATHFVYSFGDTPSSLAWRRSAAERLWQAWNKTWAGRAPSVNVVESRADGGGKDWRRGQLVIVDATTGRSRKLFDGLFDDLKVSSSGRWLAGLRLTTPAQRAPREHNLDWVQTQSQLILFDLVTTSQKTVDTNSNVFPGTLAWDQNKDRLAYFAWRRAAGVQSGVFHSAEPASWTVSLWPHRGLDLASRRERSWVQMPERVVWVGDRLAIFARENPAANPTPRFSYRDVAGRGRFPVPPKADWFLVDRSGLHKNLTEAFREVSAVPLFGDNTGLLAVADGKLWRLSPDNPPQNLLPAIGLPLHLTDDLLWSPRDKPFQNQIRLATPSSLLFFDLKRGKVLQASTPNGSIPLAASALGPTLLYRVWEPAEALQLRRGAQEAVQLSRLNASTDGVAETLWRAVHYNVHIDDAERDVQGCLLLPPNAVPGRRYPLVVDIYPGLNPTCANDEYDNMRAGPDSYSMHLLAAKGYAVFRPYTVRSSKSPLSRPLSGIDILVNQGVNALVSRGLVDGSRVGLIGYSQGGYAALWDATKTNPFKAVVSINGWTNLYSHFFDGGYQRYFFSDDVPYTGNYLRYASVEGGPFSMGVTPYDYVAAFTDDSPLTGVDKIGAAVLLVDSDLDGFSMNEYDQMFTSLYLRRKEARYLRYWGEGHTPSSPANIRDLWANIFSWFDNYLDIARSEYGNMIWAGGKVASRRGYPPRSVQFFSHLDQRS
jgi:dipeptidyl aminopeptidase/acylaminoacyl peptidase